MTTSSGQGWKGSTLGVYYSPYGTDPGQAGRQPTSSRPAAKYRAAAGLSWSYGRLRYQQLRGNMVLGACDPDLLIPLRPGAASQASVATADTTTEAGTTCERERTSRVPARHDAAAGAGAGAGAGAADDEEQEERLSTLPGRGGSDGPSRIAEHQKIAIMDGLTDSLTAAAPSAACCWRSGQGSAPPCNAGPGTGQ